VSADGDLPTPLVPAEVDLRHLPYMPLHVGRLRDSVVVSYDAEIFRAAVLLWCASWHQIPAGSLPDDDKTLARLAGLGRDIRSWQKYRAGGSLHGFVKCADGLLYHPLICEQALELWGKYAKYKARSEKANMARWKESNMDSNKESNMDSNIESKNAKQGILVAGNIIKGNIRHSESKSRLILSSRASARNALEKKSDSKRTRIPDAFEASERVRTWAMLQGITQTDLDRHVELFVGRCQRNGYRYADWDAALMSAITEDWAGLRTAAKSAHDARHGTATRDWLDDDDRPHV
jgi:hypothetical protein